MGLNPPAVAHRILRLSPAPQSGSTFRGLYWLCYWTDFVHFWGKHNLLHVLCEPLVKIEPEFFPIFLKENLFQKSEKNDVLCFCNAYNS